MPEAPAVFTIPAGLSFVDALAAGLLRRNAASPESLAAATVLLPTRRACRALQAAFLRASGGAPLLLPRLLPLGDLDPEELLFEAPSFAGEGEAGLPPAISAVQRQLLLASCILSHSRALSAETGNPVTSEDQAIRLAAELARLLDQVETEGLDFADLAGLVPEDYAAHWQITLDFLMRGISGSSVPATSRNSVRIIVSMTSMNCASFMKEVSMSICVNSGWRSARRSSSRKQRAIW
jgi:ATP-dependent helicase/nuclease subunit B